MSGPSRTGARAAELRLIGLEGIPQIAPGDPLGQIIATAIQQSGLRPIAGDVLVVTQKVVSKAEGRIVDLDDVTPGPAARALAEETGKRPELCALILAESRRIVRRRGGTVIC